MKLDRVTITGADDSIRPDQLVSISRKYPFVEWGILMSAKRVGTPRFPSADWVKALRFVLDIEPLNVAAHLCGRWVRGMLMGEVPGDLIEAVMGFPRIQLNFHGELNAVDYDSFFDAVRAFHGKQVIFQIDGRDGERHLAEMWRRDPEGDLDLVPLHDVSHGAGRSPAAWPKTLGADIYNGYAGGIGPDNVVSEIERISKVVGGGRCWIDMETKVRDRTDRFFELSKVESVLSMADLFVAREPAAPRAEKPAPWPFPERA